MLGLFLWVALAGISVAVGCWRDLLSHQRTPGGLPGQILCAFLGGWCVQVMFSFLTPAWWFVVLLQFLGAWFLTALFGRIRWEPYGEAK